MNSFVAIDLETATSFRGSICQIGITKVKDGTIQFSKSWNVQPEENKYDRFNTAIHGLSSKDTADSPQFPDVWPEVYHYLKGNLVVAHNTSFDMYALKDAFDFYQMPYPNFDYVCSLRIARYIIKGCYSYSLDVVLGHLGIEFVGHHKAGNDSKGCAELLLKCLELSQVPLENFEEAFRFHRGCFAAPNVFRPHLTIRNYSKKKNVLEGFEEHPELIDEGNYFYGKEVCFTGKLEFGIRHNFLQCVKDVGGFPANSVTRKTDVLVVGQQDYRVVGDTGMSSKQRKALSLLANGQDIEILSETEFLNRISPRNAQNYMSLMNAIKNMRFTFIAE